MLKRGMRHVDNLTNDKNRSRRGLVDCQLANEKRLVDLINCQEGRGDIPIFQVGKREEMILGESSCQQGVLTYGKEEE